MAKHESGGSTPGPGESGGLYENVVAIGKDPTIEETADIAREMIASDAGDQYKDKKLALLAEKRGMLKLALGEIDLSTLSVNLNSLFTALNDVLALSETVHLPINDYVKGELTKIRSPFIVPGPKSDVAAYSVKGLSILQNAFTRARLSPVTLRRSEAGLEGFKEHYPARVWDGAENENILLSAIDSAYDVIKIQLRRETLIVSAGDKEGRAEVDKEDERQVNKWLEDLKNEFKVQGKIRKPSSAADAWRSAQESVKAQK